MTDAKPRYRRHPDWRAAAMALVLALVPLPGPAPVARDLTAIGFEQGAPIRADTATIAKTLSTELRVYRLTAEPRITVIDFPSLAAQAAALNRIAALVELAGAPRDRLVTHGEMTRLMAPFGRDPNHFYFGHDYETTKLGYFFSLARGDLTAAEQEIFDIAIAARLIRPIASGGYSSAGPPGAVLTLSRLAVGSGGEPQEIAVRQAVLDHELAHGRFFVYLSYPEICRVFWAKTLTEAERARLRDILGSLGYDRSNEELMLNEAQAYLGFTDPAFLPVPFMGLGADRFAALRAELRDRLGHLPPL